MSKVIHSAPELSEMTVHHAEQGTYAVFESDAVSEAFGPGKDGMLFVAENLVIWWNPKTGQGIEIEYPNIMLHAVSRDTSAFPRECIYCQLESGDEGAMPAEFRLVPEDPGSLDKIYGAMSACQALHPDPEDEYGSDSGDDAIFADAPGLELSGAGAPRGVDVDVGDDDADEMELTEQGQQTMERLSNMLIVDNGEVSVPVGAEFHPAAAQAEDDGMYNDADED